MSSNEHLTSIRKYILRFRMSDSTSHIDSAERISLINALALLYRHRRMLWATSTMEIRSRYIGTLFGLGWAVLYPFLFLGIYASVYAFILGIRFGELTPFQYLLLVFSGLIPFIGFSEVISGSVSTVVGNKQLIKNTLFPVELLPVKSVIASSVSMTVSLIGLILALWFSGNFSVTQFLILPVFALQLMFFLGIAWLVSALNVFFRDVAHFVGVLVLFTMIVSPIGYTREMIPHQIVPLVYANPLFYAIEVQRQVLLFHVLSPTFLVIFIVISVGTFWLGFEVFTRLKPVFAEYV
jgi:homopolymeric O-antigen transport system permease protein